MWNLLKKNLKLYLLLIEWKNPEGLFCASQSRSQIYWKVSWIKSKMLRAESCWKKWNLTRPLNASFTAYLPMLLRACRESYVFLQKIWFIEKDCIKGCHLKDSWTLKRFDSFFIVNHEKWKFSSLLNIKAKILVSLFLVLAGNAVNMFLEVMLKKGHLSRTKLL